MSTKKKTFAGIAVAGAAAVAITGGTFATFSDSDSATVSANAGSVVLDIDGAYQDGVAVPNIAPGDKGCWETTFTNGGTETAKLSLSDFSITNNENGVNPAEVDAGDTSADAGELSKYLEVSFEGNDYVELSKIEQYAGSGIVTPTLSEDGSYTLNTCVRFPKSGTAGAENAAQTDGIVVDWTVTLEQA